MILNRQEIDMPRKTFTPEQIIAMLRQIEVLIGQGKPVPQAVRHAGISEQSYYRWRKEYGRPQGPASVRACAAGRRRNPAGAIRQVPLQVAGILLNSLRAS
jgi:hypothetical protein